jgi:hypothetical protein
MDSRELTIGLTLIVIGLIADIGAGYALPSPPACKTVTCTAAEIVGLVALVLLLLGIGLQIRALSKAKAEATVPPAFQSGLTPSTPPPWGIATPPVVPARSTLLAAGATASGRIAPAAPSSTAPAVRCGRCGAAYEVGQFSYCPACGNPLPFAP